MTAGRGQRPADIAQLCNPESVAVIGASDDDRKFGGRVIKYLLKHRFPGTIVPINPTRDRILGLPAFPTVVAAGRPIDVAIMATPVEHLEASIEDCARAGVKFAVVITANFAEAGPEGAKRQERILEIAHAGGTRILGPNCLGLMAPGAGLALSPSVSLERDDFRAGRVGLVSQSGALMGTMFDYAADRGIAFSLCVSVGNQADLELCDFLDHLIEDPATTVISAYVEGLADPARFLDCARRAHAAGKPLLVTKAGRSEAGAAAAQSHTASLAGSYATFAAACHSVGVVLLDDPNGMVEVAGFLARTPRYAGGGAAIASGSGGGCAVALDRLSEIGFPAAELSPDTAAAMDGLLAPVNRHLPLDLGVLQSGWTRAGVGRALDHVMTDPATGVGISLLTTQPLMVETAEEGIRAARQAGKPLVLALLAGTAGEKVRDACRALDHPWFDSMDGAIRALRAVSDVSQAELAHRIPISAPTIPSEFETRSGALGEHETKRLVAAAGIRVTRECLAADADAAVATAREIGYPVVLKAVSAKLLHKSDVGAVKLNLRDDEAVRLAFAQVADALSRHGVGGFEGCLVQEMGRGEMELVLGVKNDPAFGPAILIGTGGVAVELLDDVQVALAPVSPGQALAMMKRLKHWPLLDGFRGRKPLDAAAAAEAASRLSHLAAQFAGRLLELDINPLLVGERGNGVIAVDGRATLADLA